jgi:hypothetical protein
MKSAANLTPAYAQAKHDWVLSLDADERVTAELRDEITALLAKGDEDEASAARAFVKDDVPCLYWTSSALGKWAKLTGLTTTLKHLPTVKAYMTRVGELDGEIVASLVMLPLQAWVRGQKLPVTGIGVVTGVGGGGGAWSAGAPGRERVSVDADFGSAFGCGGRGDGVSASPPIAWRSRTGPGCGARRGCGARPAGIRLESQSGHAAGAATEPGPGPTRSGREGNREVSGLSEE